MQWLEPNVRLLQLCKIANSFISSKLAYLYKLPWAQKCFPQFCDPFVHCESGKSLLQIHRSGQDSNILKRDYPEKYEMKLDYFPLTFCFTEKKTLQSLLNPMSIIIFNDCYSKTKRPWSYGCGWYDFFLSSVDPSA